MGARAPQPDDGDERSIALGWLAFHRDALAAKCAELTPEQLVERAAPPSHLSLLGLVRHMAEMEHAYGSWPMESAVDFAWVWGSYVDDAEEDIDCTAADVEPSMTRWREEIAATDDALTDTDLDTLAPANGHTVRWNVAKLVGEYARHNGHADLLRERIDGETGE